MCKLIYLCVILLYTLSAAIAINYCIYYFTNVNYNSFSTLVLFYCIDILLYIMVLRYFYKIFIIMYKYYCSSNNRINNIQIDDNTTELNNIIIENKIEYDIIYIQNPDLSITIGVKI